MRGVLAAVATVVTAAVIPISVAASAQCPPPVIAPVRGVITDSYRPPACRWCAGNRGWEIAVREPYVVVSSTDGIVSFAGKVGGIAYVVIETGCGLRVTYGRLDDPLPFTAGQTVTRGEHLGRSRQLFLGLRQGATRLDPALLWGPRRVRLVSPANPAVGSSQASHRPSVARPADGRRLVRTVPHSVA